MKIPVEYSPSRTKSCFDFVIGLVVSIASQTYGLLAQDFQLLHSFVW